MATPTFHIETQNQDVRLKITGDLNAQHAGKLKAFLVESSVLDGNRTLDLLQVTAFDPSAIQLTYSWKKNLTEKGRTVNIMWPADSNLIDLLQKTGILKIF
jgi:ABC-type transporter Mla MlaB component